MIIRICGRSVLIGGMPDAVAGSAARTIEPCRIKAA